MEPDVFESLVDRYKDSLINYLRHLTRSHDRAEEIAQEAFVRLYRSDTTHPAYLFRIATNLVISQVRRERRWRLLLPMFAATHPGSEPATDRVATSEIQRKVAAALDRLPAKLRAPLVLFEIEEWPYHEIARVLNCRLGTVKSRISRARALMRAELESWWIGGNDDRRRNWQCDAATAASDSIASIHV
jgi:RNA polymerase sigma factor (sigma-70 family)